MNSKLTRRSLLGQAAASLTAAGQPAARPPNLVFLFSDQQPSDMLGCYGNEQVQTPNVDRFARDAVRFNHCISNSPVCTPYRGILFSGQHPLNTGAVTNDYQMLRGDENYFAHVLRDHGYRTGYVGKWHLYGGDRRRPIPAGPYRHGFDDTFLSNNCTLEFRAGHAYYWDAEGKKVTYDDWEPYGQARQANQFIDENADRPFALFVSWHPPHNWQGQGAYPAPEELLARYDESKVKLRPSVDNSDESRHRFRGHMALCTSIDIAFGRILDKLRERNLLENTIVVYTSDHGDMLFRNGSHMAKCHPTADSCRVPLLIRWPGKLQPRSSDLMIGALDLMPTLLSFVNLPVPKSCQGRDLTAAIRDRKDDAVESVPLFIMVSDKANWRGVYTRQHTYSFERPDSGSQAPDQFNRLYDRKRDPHELKNLFDAREHKSLREKLHRQTLDWMQRFGDDHVPHSTVAAAILENEAEAKLPVLTAPGCRGTLRGRPIDFLPRRG